MTRPSLDLTLYLIVGPSHVDGDPAPLVRDAVRGGVTLVQLRDKTSTTGGMVASARALKAALDGTGVPLLINDRADVAVAAGADGVHLGRDDLSPADARAIVGSDRIVGVTVKNPSEARAVEPGIVDYASVGGVFSTESKINPDPPIGLDGLREMAAVLTAGSPGLPRCAIAGIDGTRAAEVIAAGVDGVCVVSAITRSTDPFNAAQQLRAVVDAAKREHERSFA
ncbi:MAG: thiamine phosphate synthase [Alphaproteobacteria bacterium]|nr:thiamine phosphate synthase [Alphaproteobacteria bacterium]